MANETQPEALTPSRANIRPEPAPSTIMAEQMSISWSEDLSSPTASHKMPWDLSLFSLESHPELSPNSLTAPHSGAQIGQENIQAEFDAPLSAGFEATPSLAGSFSSVDSDGMPTNPRTAKNARAVSSLTPEQLERKRRNDRRAQRAIRERTKQRMEEYQGVLAQKDEMIRVLSRRVKVLEGELAMYRGQKRRGVADGLRTNDKTPRMLDRSTPHPKCLPIPGTLRSNNHCALAPETMSPISLPSPLSNSQSNSTAIDGIASDIGYTAVQELDETHLGAAPWSGDHTLPQAPAALPSMTHPTATDLDGLPGGILF